MHINRKPVRASILDRLASRLDHLTSGSDSPGLVGNVWSTSLIVNLRDDVKQSDLDIDLGPDEDEFKVTDQELQSTQQKEINRLRNDLRDAEKQIDSLSLKVQIGDGNQAAGYKRRGKQELSTLRKELKEFTINTQQDLERERAELLTRVAMMEEENKELQDYIDNHLIRYKEEIVRLRDMHGMLDAGGFVSPDKNSRPPRRL